MSVDIPMLPEAPESPFARKVTPIEGLYRGPDISNGIDPLAPNRGDTPETRSARQELEYNYTPGQARDVLRGRPEFFGTALHLTRNADRAFELTVGYVPDEVARVQFHSARLGIDPVVVKENLKTIEEQVSYLDQREVMKNAPNVLQWASRPENMAIAKDSLKHLSHMESLLVSRYGTLTQQAEVAMANLAHSTLKGFAGAAQATAETAEAVVNFADTGGAEISDPAKANGALATATQFWREAADSQDAVIVPFTDEVRGVRRFALDLAPAAAQMAAGALLTAATKSPAPLIAAFGAMEGGGIYHDLREQEVGHLRALLVGAGVGVVNGYLESLQIGKATKLADVGRKMAFKELATTFVENATQETIQNVVAEAGSLLGEAGVRDIKLGEYVERLKTAVGEGAYEGLLAGVASMMFAAPRLRHLHQTYQESLEQSTRLQAALALAEQSPLGQRSPDAMADAVNHITGGKRASLQADLLDTMFQDNVEVRNDMLQKLGVTPEAYEAALATGDDIEFDLGNWVKVQGAEQAVRLFDHIRVGDLLTRAELSGAKEDLINAVAGVHEALDSFDPAAEDPEQLKAIRTALMTGGGMNAADADRIVDVLRGGSERFAKYSNESTEEWFARVNPSIKFGVDGPAFVREKMTQTRERAAAQEVAPPRVVDPLRDVAAIASQPWVAVPVVPAYDKNTVKNAGEYAEELGRKANTYSALLDCLRP